MSRVHLTLIAICALSLFGCSDMPANYPADNIEENAEAIAMRVSPPDELVFCPVIQQKVSKSDCDDLEAVRTDVRRGSAAFNVPDPMQRDETVSIHLVVDRRAPAEIAILDDIEFDANEAVMMNGTESNGGEATNNVVSPPNAKRSDPSVDEPDEPAAPTPKARIDPLEGRTETLAPKVGRFMSAELSGPGFDIKPVTPRSQEVPEGGQQTWTWEVTARQKGTKVLTLKTVVEGEVNGQRYMIDNTQTEKSVEVKVGVIGTIGDALDAAPKWLKRLALVLSALATLVGAWFGLRAALRKGKGPPSQP